MCGFFVSISNSALSNTSINQAMNVLSVRGPDSSGEFRDNGIFLGFRRLAILDLNVRSSQPMHSTCKRYVIVFNGEIYNFKSLRLLLEESGYIFNTESDTEVLLNMFIEFGCSMLSMLRGMFSFTIWDKLLRVCFAARDAYGIKPLYIGRSENGIILSSQVKAIIAANIISNDIDPLGDFSYWMLGSICEPYSLFKNITSLPAGSYIWVRNYNESEIVSWCDVSTEFYNATEVTKSSMSTKGIINKVNLALLDSVKSHLTADVPVGVLLSGGLDSAVICSLMVELGYKNFTAITIQFQDYKDTTKDESLQASQIAQHYGINHHIRTITFEEFEQDLQKYFTDMDLPTVDALNTWYACKAASEIGLKVVLSGLGGDELFHGYKFFRQIPKIFLIFNFGKIIPGFKSIIILISKFLSMVKKDKRWLNMPILSESILGAWLFRHNLINSEKINQISNTSKKELNTLDFLKMLEYLTGKLSKDSVIALSQLQSELYMRNQLLRDSDWASMSHGVELRVPYVDIFLLKQIQPYLSKITTLSKKDIITKGLKYKLPPSILKNRKKGFEFPVQLWLQRLDPSLKTSYRNWFNWMKYVADAYLLKIQSLQSRKIL